MARMYLIGEMAARTGLSVHAINYYIHRGLISASARAGVSGYRLFDDNVLQELKRIVELRRAKISIREILARKQDGIL